MEKIQPDFLGCGGSDPMTATRDGNPWDMMGVDPRQALQKLPIQETGGEYPHRFPWLWGQ